MNLVKKILVIDDDKNVRHLLKLELSDNRYRVITASGAYDGFNILKAKKINMVILDIKMASMGGIEALEKVKDEAIIAMEVESCL